MRISKYTFLFTNQDSYYVYNSLSNALLEIDSELYTKLEYLKKTKAQITEQEDKEVVETLLQNNIITESDTDDLLVYKSIIQQQRSEQTFMHLTLAPTMDCCFKCHYCFEKYKSKKHMTPEIMESIIEYVNNQKSLNGIHLTWFGGEPLLAIKEIDEFYTNYSGKLNSKIVQSNIITTGFHLDEESIQLFKKNHINMIQITLDGIKETHNRIKFLKECDDVFSKVIDNIELLNDLAPEIHIAIRVNLTLKNAHEFSELVSFFQHRFNNRKNISITPAFVLDRGTSNSKKCQSTLFNHKQRSQYILKLAKEGYNVSQMLYPSRFINECAIRNKVAISFDSEGYAYKCWEVIGNQKYAIGKLDTKGQIINVNNTMLNRQLYGSDPLDDPKCKECNYLPICNGGCPIQRIENEFEGGHNDNCTYYKNYIEDFIKMHLKVKEKLSQKI